MVRVFFLICTMLSTTPGTAPGDVDDIVGPLIRLAQQQVEDATREVDEAFDGGGTPAQAIRALGRLHVAEHALRVQVALRDALARQSELGWFFPRGLR